MINTHARTHLIERLVRWHALVGEHLRNGARLRRGGGGLDPLVPAVRASPRPPVPIAALPPVPLGREHGGVPVAQAAARAKVADPVVRAVLVLLGPLAVGEGDRRRGPARVPDGADEREAREVAVRAPDLDGGGHGRAGVAEGRAAVHGDADGRDGPVDGGRSEGVEPHERRLDVRRAGVVGNHGRGLVVVDEVDSAGARRACGADDLRDGPQGQAGAAPSQLQVVHVAGAMYVESIGAMEERCECMDTGAGEGVIASCYWLAQASISRGVPRSCPKNQIYTRLFFVHVPKEDHA